MLPRFCMIHKTMYLKVGVNYLKDRKGGERGKERDDSTRGKYAQYTTYTSVQTSKINKFLKTGADKNHCSHSVLTNVGRTSYYLLLSPNISLSHI